MHWLTQHLFLYLTFPNDFILPVLITGMTGSTPNNSQSYASFPFILMSTNLSYQSHFRLNLSLAVHSKENFARQK